MANDNPTFRAIQKYKKKTYDRIELLVYKGEKEKIKLFADKRGKTVNGFITELIRKEMSKEDEENNSEKTG